MSKCHIWAYLFSYVEALPPPHTDAFFMRCVATRHDAFMHIRGRIVTNRNGTDEKRIRVGLALALFTPPPPHQSDSSANS